MALNKRVFLFNLPKIRFRELINCVKKFNTICFRLYHLNGKYENSYKK